jgi:hypothetical protein
MAPTAQAAARRDSVPHAYAPLLSAVAAAAAALIGLLFVAVTVDPERVRL